MSQHTPGPWTFRAPRQAKWTILGGSNGQRRTVCAMVNTCFEDEAEANARLIAKAPETVELLKCYIGAHDTMTAKTLAQYDAEARALLREIEGNP